jgi:hypothetical protein
MALLDKIKQRQQQPQQIPVGGQTEAAAKLLAAKTGKAQVAPQAPISTEQETAAQQATQAQLGQVAQQGQMKALGAGIQEEQQQQQFKANQDLLALQGKTSASDRKQKLASMTQNYQQSLEQLGLDKESANMNANLFEMRMSSQKYLDNLTRDRTLDRAFTAADRRSELLKMQLDEDFDLRAVGRKNQEVLLDKELDWNEKIATIDIDSAMRMAEQAIAAENQRAIWEGGTEAVKGGLDIWAKSEEKKK